MSEATTGKPATGGTGAPQRERRKLGLRYGEAATSTRPLPSPGSAK